MDLISKVLHYIGKNKKDVFVVQIGAMDGINFDDTRGFLDMYQWNALLVEPIPALFNELKENFKDRNNYIFEQCAVGNHDGQIEMLTVPPEVIEREGLHPGYKGMSAQYPLKNGFGTTYERDIEVKEKFGVDVIVPCLTFNSLCTKHNISKIDILICDAEGYDWEIFKQFDFTKYHPGFIRLEYINLTDEEKVLTVKKLEENGYIVEIGLDIDATIASLWNKINKEDIGNTEVQEQPEQIVQVEAQEHTEQDENILDYYIEKYGSDKKISHYSDVYNRVFEKIRQSVNMLLEVGIGSIDSKFECAMTGIFDHYPHYKPGASLRAWRDYFGNAQIYGVDIDEKCKFEEDRIKTFIFDSRNKDKCDEHLKDLLFNIIIDDGNHSSDAQIETLKNLFPYVGNNGLYAIEDCGGYGAHLHEEHIYVKYYDEFTKIANDHEYIYMGNFIVIRKSNSKLGHLNTLGVPYIDDFLDRIDINMESKIESNVDAGSNAVNENKTEPSIEIKPKVNMAVTENLTVVTGLWNIGRVEREFIEHYIENFKKFLDFPVNMFIYIPEEYEYIVWEKRSKENTSVRVSDLDYIKHIYEPFWDRTQDIRNDPKWFNMTGDGGWLKTSPQATLEYYDPIVQSKMFLLNDVSIWNPFNTEYFIWLDAGITNTVYEKMFTDNRALDKIIPHLNEFLFLSYPYDAVDEIHGFNFTAINQYAGQTVKYVCRGGLFGGKKEAIHEANATYYATLDKTLSGGYMGTEESIFAIMSYREPNIYRRYALDGNGLIVKFIDALINDKVVLEPVLKDIKRIHITNHELSKIKTNLYILTFNFPEQLLYLIDTMKKVPEWLEKPHLVLIDNSTNEEAISGNSVIAKQYNMEHIIIGENKGICGGRQKAAEHFHESDADFYLFHEDDMCINPSELEGQFCKNGFRKYVPNLYNIIHKIMIRENFDFLKLSFSEIYFDNDKALPWYNTPQHIRTRDWPDYDKLPITGLDPNSPPAKYDHIKICDGVAFLVGEINYCNWPMIVSKEGNKKMFIDTTWAHPYEQTWSSHIYQLEREGKINAGLLLASPIWHERIKYYEPEERREN